MITSNCLQFSFDENQKGEISKTMFGQRVGLSSPDLQLLSGHMDVLGFTMIMLVNRYSVDGV